MIYVFIYIKNKYEWCVKISWGRRMLRFFLLFEFKILPLIFIYEYVFYEMITNLI